MVHQRVWFDKAFMHLLTQNATLPLIPSASVLWWSQQQVFLNVKRANRFFLSVYQMGQRVSRLYLIGVDRGDSGHQFLKWVMDCLGWMIQVVLRPQQTQGFVLEKKIGGCTNFWFAQLVSTVEQGRSINNPYITF
jgi:hypothetical protein